jgi:hypothetical protein
MARWITVRRRFDYHWPGRSALTAFRDPGEYMVKDEVADFAVANGHATEGKLAGSKARSRKGKTETHNRGKAAAKGSAAAETADNRPGDRVAEPDLAVPDRPDDRASVDQPSG